MRRRWRGSCGAPGLRTRRVLFLRVPRFPLLYKNSTKKTATEAMDTAFKLQDPRVTARWHNIWLRTALFFLVTTVTFAGVFGWAFTQWKEDDSCHEYHANLVHLPNMDDSLPTTTLLLHNGELHLRKGATYDESSCEGKLVQRLIKKGNVLDIQEGRDRRLSELPAERTTVSPVSSRYNVQTRGKKSTVLQATVQFWNGAWIDTYYNGIWSGNWYKVIDKSATHKATKQSLIINGIRLQCYCSYGKLGNNDDICQFETNSKNTDYYYCSSNIAPQ